MKKITLFAFFIIAFIGNAQSLEGTWKMLPQAGAMGVGPNQGDMGWWSNGAGDVTARACFFDDEYVFTAAGGFSNVKGSQTWVENWQDGGGDSCRTPIAPHNGSNTATYTYDSGAGTITLNGVGAHLGLAKVYNGGELASPAGAPASITYTVSALTATEMTLDISIGTGWWRFKMQKQVVASPIEGTWKMLPQPGAMGVGPNQGDMGWWANGAGDVTARACFFDDEYVFTAAGVFSNVKGSQTWVENWQDGGGDSCRTPVAPHNGSSAATYTYNSGAGTITLNGLGAHLGLAKVYNGGELASPAGAPASITYTVSALTATEMTLDISIGTGWWRFKMLKQGIPTCNDGVQNGDETGVDCGGTTCPACITPPTVAAPTPPARPVGDVISLYSNAYPSLPLTVGDWDTGAGWGGGTTITDLQIAGDDTKKLAFGSFIGVDFGVNRFDASAMTYFHMDYWIPAATDLVGKVLNPKWSHHNGGPGEVSAFLLTHLPTTAGSWQSIDVPLTSFDSAPQTRTDLKQFLISSNLGVVYVDNIYLHKNTVLATESFSASKIKMYPNPATNVLSIEALSNIEKVSVYNMLGQEVISKSINNQSVNLDVANLQSGMYIIKVNIDGVISASRFVKE